MRILAVTAMMMAACAGQPGSGREQEFSSDMLGRLRKALPDVTLTAKPGEPLVILARGGQWSEAQFNLHRIFAFCAQAAPADCEATKVEYAERVTAKPVAPSRDALRLIVRDAEYVDYVRQLPGEAMRGVVLEPLGGDLFTLLAIDSPNQIGLVTEQMLAELGLDRAAAWELARKQTAAGLPAMPTPAQLARGPVAYEAKEYLGSLLTDLSAWAALAREVGPDLFVTVVSDQFVFVARMPDGPELDAFKRNVAEDCAAQQRCISPLIYRFRDGRWTPAK